MAHFRKLIAAAGLAAAAGLFVAAAAAASPSIEAAKAACVVGEQSDGYLGVVDGAEASEELRREVRSINQQRRAAYEGLAARNGVTVEVTAALTAERLMNQAPAGHCIRDESGWRRK